IFEPHALAADSVKANATLGVANLAHPMAPQNRRVFLLVLGRGRLEVVAHGLTATAQFIRDRLLPQDIVPVMAWDRAIGFSSDRTEALAFLDRFSAEHERVEQELRDWFSGLRGVYGSKEIPPAIQAHIDRVFGKPVTQVIGAPSPVNAQRMAWDNRDTANAVQTQTTVNSLGTGVGGTRVPGTVGLTQAQEAALAGGRVTTARLP